MAARQSFEQSQRASQMGIGYGEAQVSPVGVVKNPFDMASYMERGLQRQERKDKKKEESLEIAEVKDVLPIYQTLLNKESADLYAWGKEHYNDEDFDVQWNQKKMEFGSRVAEAKDKSKILTELSGDFDPQKVYDQDSRRSAELSYNYDAVLDDKGNVVFGFEEGSDVVDDAIRGLREGYISTDFEKDKLPSFRNMVNYSAPKNKLEVILPSGEQVLTESSTFSENDAYDLIYKNMQTMTPDYHKTGLATMTDQEKANYGEDYDGVAKWYADRHKGDVARDINNVTRTPAPKGKAKAIDEVVLTMNDGSSNTNYKADGDVVKSKVAFANQQALTPLKGEEDNVAITVGNYYDVDAGEWIDETSKYMVTPTTIQDYVIWNGEEPLNIEIEGKEIEIGKGVYLPEEYVQKLTPKEKENTSWQTAIEGVVKKDGTDVTIRIPQTKVNQSAYTTIAQQRKIYDKYMNERSGSVREEEEPKKRSGTSKYAAKSFTHKGVDYSYDKISQDYTDEEIDEAIKKGLLKIK